MPTVHIKQEYFFKLFGKTIPLKELEEICFDFGIEVEQDKEDPTKVIFEIAANRYDLLCAEGLAEALAIFSGVKTTLHAHKLVKPEKHEKITVKQSCKQIRPYVVGAILRNITFEQDRYESFIDLQDKLHQNICRKRTLVAIGTHDLDTVKGPFTYSALPPKDINFIPLNQTEKMSGEKLMEFYANDNKLKHYLHIIKDSPVYPVITDSNDTVMSLPPIINGDHSKIKLTTKNVFIECTATDYTKALIVLNMVVTCFSRYCGDQFSVEEVEVVYEGTNEKRYTPDFTQHKMDASVDYLSTLTGVKFTADDCLKHLFKMGVPGHKIDEKKIQVSIPVTRSDILHPCDLAEDVAIGYGYNKIPDILPASATSGSQLTINKMTDLIRQEVAQSGYKECLNFCLCSLNEVSKNLNKPEGKKPAVIIGNPKTQDFECGRTTLIPGLLKTLASNKAQKLPIKLFEAGDVILKTDNEVGARNERRLAALYCDQETSGFEFIHGLLDYLMIKLNIPNDAKAGYVIKESKDSTFFPGRQAEIFLNGDYIGVLGIIHPEVLKEFDLNMPISLIELNLEQLVFKGFFKEK